MHATLLDFRASDGSRQFAEVPWVSPRVLRDHVARMAGATVTGFLDTVTETWLDFTYRGHRFTAHNPFNDFWLFVNDPACPEEILREVVAHAHQAAELAGGGVGVADRSPTPAAPPPPPPPPRYRRLLVGRRISEPGCGRCGYPVRGLAGTVCPECGADQDVVGVVQPLPPRPRWVGTLALLAAWAAVLAFLAWVGNGALLSHTPRALSNHRDYVLKPASGLYGPVDVRRIGYGWGWKTPRWAPRTPDRGWAQMGPEEVNGRYLTHLSFEHRTGSISYAITRYEDGGARQTPLTSRAAKLDDAGVIEWLSQLEVDTTRPAVRAEAAELAGLLAAPDFVPAHHERLRHFAVVSVSGGPEIVPPRYGQFILNIAWLTVGLAGAAVIAHVRRAPVGGRVSRLADSGSV